MENKRQALIALRNRLEHKPAIYKRGRAHETIWWMTPFTYEQLEGNRLECLRLIKQALEQE